MEFRAVDRAAQQREDIFAAEILLLAPEVCEGLVRAVVEQLALVGAGKSHHLVTHFDDRVVVFGVELGCIEGCACGEGPGCGLVGHAVLLGCELREEGQAFAGFAQVADDLVVVLQYGGRARAVHGCGLRRVEDDRNAAVGAVVTVVGREPQHGEPAEEIGGAGGFGLERVVEVHRRDDLDDVVGLGVDLVHDLPVVLHVAAVAGRHAEVADVFGFALGAAYGHVVAAAFEPRDAAARDALGVVRVEGEEGDECFLYVFLGLPVRLGSVFLGVEEVFAAR